MAYEASMNKSVTSCGDFAGSSVVYRNYEDESATAKSELNLYCSSLKPELNDC